jgi:hypothetical protein
MQRWASIVEGHGEVRALPQVLRLIAAWKVPNEYFDLPTPIRVQKDRFLNRQEEFVRCMLLARAKAEEGGRVLLLLDADDDCPKEKGAELLQRAREVVPDRQVSVVLANREFETWFIASASSLAGVRGFAPLPDDHIVDPERPRDAKGWISARMPSGYGETTDQPAFAAQMDVALAFERSRSFRKLCKELIG